MHFVRGFFLKNKCNMNCDETTLCSVLCKFCNGGGCKKGIVKSRCRLVVAFLQKCGTRNVALLEDVSDTGIIAYKLSVSKKVVILYM